MIQGTSMYAPSDFGTASGKAASTPQQVDKNMFMRLMIAQLRNQDPLNPSDGTQFVAQLAQFQQLEQSVNSGEDLTGIRQDLDAILAALNGGAQATQS